ncbi:Hpt domain-containing protein [Granulicella sp. WH15]|uniref:Hpt domain-containing protein n=1 Tax=Granulicella sp. WH15 TaxID=2602070 RepID=UPI0013A561B3|nr:Hpt domain-containing protein [Granulicella sp. WH15]
MTSPNEKTKALLASLWERNKPILLERLAVLNQAATADPLPPELKAEAASVAHKLAGTLGMFGHMAATRLAQELEATLEAETPDRTRLSKLATELRRNLPQL